MMFNIVFFSALVVIAFLSCVALDIAYRVVASNKAAREYCDKENVCDACGKNPKAENSQIYKECETKANDN